MTTPAPSPADDAAAARALLGPANPVPDLSLPSDQLLAARASVGVARTRPAPGPGRGRFLVAGAVAALSVATLIAIVAIPASRGPATTSLATGPGARVVAAAAAATQASETARGLLTVTHDGGTVTASGTGSFDSGDARAEISLPGDARLATVTVLRTRTGIYARLPDGMSPFSADKPWVSVDAPTLARMTQLALGDAGAQITGAPLDALAYLEAVSGEVVVVGADTTRGEPTTHYRAAVDPAKVAAQLPAALRAHAAAASGPPASLPADLWIDDQGRLRKLVVDASGAVAAPGRGPTTITLELWDFGTPVEVAAPPADQVADVSGLLSSFAQNLQRP